MLDRLGQDLRLASRAFLHRPAIALLVLGLVGLGVGSTTAVFTLVKAIFIEPFEVDQADRVVALYRTFGEPGGRQSGFGNFSYPEYLDFEDLTEAFSSLSVYQWHPVNLAGGSQSERIAGMFVSANYFDTLGLEPAVGRFFSPGDDERGGAPVTVLSYGAWHRLFGGDREILGREVLLNGHKLSVVGVAPKGFRSTELAAKVDAWIPITRFESLSPYAEYFEMRGAAFFRVIGRLRPGVSAERASDELMALSRELDRDHGEEADRGVSLIPVVESAVIPREREAYRRHASILSAGAALVLGAICLNVIVLLLLEGKGRAGDFEVLQILGAQRSDLIRSRLVSCFVIFGLGGGLGLLVSRVGVAALSTFLPPELDHASLNLAPDLPVFLFAFALTALCGLACGVLPALHSQMTMGKHVVRGDPGSTTGTGLGRWGHVLVVAQLSLAFLALTVAMVLGAKLAALQRIDLGFEPDLLAVGTVAPGDMGYEDERTKASFGEIRSRVETLPGVEVAAFSENRLLRGAILRREVYRPGEQEPVKSADRTAHWTNIVTPGFFRAAGIDLLKGRDFGPVDCSDCRRVAIINQTMARALWPDGPALGRRFHLVSPSEPTLEVVGIAEDAKYRYIEEDPNFFIYLPLGQNVVRAMTLHVRAAQSRDPETIVPEIRDVVHGFRTDLPVNDLGTMRQFVDDALWRERMAARFVASFGSLALAISLVGLFGVTSYWVRSCRPEIGLRLSLGARRRSIVWTVLRRALLSGVAGLFCGGVASALLVIYNNKSFPASAVQLSLGTVLLPSALLILAVLGGACLPAVRAAWVSPARALRDL